MSYTTLMVSIIMYGLGQILVIFCCLQVNKIVYKKINMLLHDLSWIPIIMQSFNPISCLVFEIRQSKLNNNNNNNNNNDKKTILEN